MWNSKNHREQSLPPRELPVWLALVVLSAACCCLILATTRLVPILTEMAAERRMYLPLAALVALVGIGGYSLLTRLAANSNARRPAGCRRQSPSSKKRSNCSPILPTLERT